MSEITLQTVVADLARLPALPKVVQDLIDYLQHPEVDVGQVAQRITRDSALTAKVLRVANSSFLRAAEPSGDHTRCPGGTGSTCRLHPGHRGSRSGTLSDPGRGRL